MDHLLDHAKRTHENYLISDSSANPETMRQSLGARTINCETHGPYESIGTKYMGRHEVWSRCPACEAERMAAERHQEAERKAQEHKAHMERLLDQACIPQRFIGRTLDSFRAETDAQQTALEIASRYVSDFAAHEKKGTGLIFSGLPGTGKSHLAVAILQALMPAKCGIYTTCMSVIRNVRGTWRKDSERSEQDVLNAYCEADLLVIDEVGVQYGTDGEQTILFDVIDRRYREMMPTIILTNQAKAGFKEFIGDRSFDRLVEVSRWVPFDWPSYRPQARRDAV